jgi:transposase
MKRPDRVVFQEMGKQDLTPEQKEIQTLKKALHESEMENRVLKRQ